MISRAAYFWPRRQFPWPVFDQMKRSKLPALLQMGRQKLPPCGMEFWASNHHQFRFIITYKQSMDSPFFDTQRIVNQSQLRAPMPNMGNGSPERPKILTNLILKLPPESQGNLELSPAWLNCLDKDSFGQVPSSPSFFQEKLSFSFDYLRHQNFPKAEREVEDHRVKAKTLKKGKRDGQNIRTYARYDSIIQVLEEELAANKIVPSNQDLKMVDQFEMKSKRSLQRIFFYLLLAKRENKLQNLLPNMKLKIRAKILQKGGHRTSQFISSLQNCIEKYIEAAEQLQKATSLDEARKAFGIAYLSDMVQSKDEKRPHHNKIKGMDKCVNLFKNMIQSRKNSVNNAKPEATLPPIPQKAILQLPNAQDHKEAPNQQASSMIDEKDIEQGIDLSKKFKKRLFKVMDDQSFNAPSEELLENPNDKKKKSGVKNKKQDDRDIQKYAKFDIVSESSLQFLKIQKLHRNIPEVCKKLSQRSLHFFFVILALIQKENKEAEFLAHLENNYEKKVHKRYSQRSQYFRERLHKSFFNLIQATGALFQGRLNEALDIAYEVKSEKRTHPAKASQQKKCRQIYDAIRSSFQTNGEQSRLKLELLIQSDKGHRSQLIKQIKCPSIKSITNQLNASLSKADERNCDQPLMIIVHKNSELCNEGMEHKIEEGADDDVNRRTLITCDKIQINRQMTGITICTPKRVSQVNDWHDEKGPSSP